MGFVSRLYYFFAPYTDARERTVGRFFKGLTERSDRAQARAGLDELLQRDIAVINLWTEYRYKGYRYLRKSRRRQLYANLQLIIADFDRFYANHASAPETAIAHIHSVAPHAVVDPAKAVLLHTMTQYFAPARGIYEYRESSSFGRLLRDPAHETLVGDCNQIVTLYVYLYSRYYDVSDLQVRVLPEHVALHYGGVDIETTDSSFADYANETGSALLPIEEIVSINLLDTTDSYLSKHEVAPEDLLQASRFAYILSHDRELVTRNLSAAYGILVNSLLERNNYKRALEFALASHDADLLKVVGHNGAVYEMQHHNYAAARRFAEHAPEREALTNNSWHAEGVYHYQARRYHEAIKAFGHLGDQTAVRQCYEALFFEEQEKLGQNLTEESIKNYASVINRMHTYANKSGNHKLIEYVASLKQHI